MGSAVFVTSEFTFKYAKNPVKKLPCVLSMHRPGSLLNTSDPDHSRGYAEIGQEWGQKGG